MFTDEDVDTVIKYFSKYFTTAVLILSEMFFASVASFSFDMYCLSQIDGLSYWLE